MNKTATRRSVKVLREQGEDYEFYPTTDEVTSRLWRDIRTYTKKNSSGYRDTGFKYSRSYQPGSPDSMEIGTFLDIGTGDGRILLNPPKLGCSITVKRPMGIEKSAYHADKLIKDGVWLLGRDYMKMTLIDKKFNVVFCNPPYSSFKGWCDKICTEVDSDLIYLLVPQRWQDDEFLKTRISKKGNVKVLGSYGFGDGDRYARATVDLIRITRNRDTQNVFANWVTENIGSFVAKEEEDLMLEREEFVNTHLTADKKDVTTTLVENYEREMQNILKTYKALNDVDFSLLQQLEISRETIINSVACSIQSLKYKFWEQAFSHIDSFKTRLTYKTANGILEDLKEFRELDFNRDNIRNIAIWVVENFNDLTKKQMLKCYDDMTYFGSVRAYKSNDKWLDDSWRYNKPFPTKHMLDYRIVTSGRSLSRYNFLDHGSSASDPFDYGYGNALDNVVSDLAVVACSLGYQNDGFNFQIEHGKEYHIKDKEGEILISFRAYKNRNIHIKIRKDLLRDLNVEVGKLKGWIKSPQDIQYELEMSHEDAVKYFEEDSIMLMRPQTSFQNLLAQ